MATLVMGVAAALGLVALGMVLVVLGAPFLVFLRIVSGKRSTASRPHSIADGSTVEVNINKNRYWKLLVVEIRLSGWMERHGLLLLRLSLGIVFIWFGLLKPLHVSPAEELVKGTTSFLFDPTWFVPFLGFWEMAIGLCMFWRATIRIALLLLFLQMPGTMLPLVLMPEVCWTQFPYALTVEGQYIIKNLVLISAGMVIGGTLRHAGIEGERLAQRVSEKSQLLAKPVGDVYGMSN